MSKTTKKSAKVESNAMFYVDDCKTMFIDGVYDKANNMFTYKTKSGAKVKKQIETWFDNTKHIYYKNTQRMLRPYNDTMHEYEPDFIHGTFR